jgi:hypothetical protein
MPAHMRRAASVAALSLFVAFGATALLAADTDKPAMTAPAPGKLSFYRLYTSADGNSHFSNETIELTPLNGTGAEAHLTAARVGDTKNAMILSLPAGRTEPYHVAPRRQLMVCLRGIVEVTAGDGDKRRVLPGQFVLLEDTKGKGHITHSVGPEDHVALAFPVADDVLTKK